MEFFRRVGRTRRPEATHAWRAAWARAIASPDAAALEELERALRREPRLTDDLEMEEEMLDALRQLVGLASELAAGRLPCIPTSHRIVGADLCHFSAPVSLPDDPQQPTGRLLLTSTRAAFAGPGRVPPLAWHAIRDVAHRQRDVLVVPVSGASAHGEAGVRFRCNSFGDAVCATAIARHLAGAARRPRTP